MPIIYSCVCHGDNILADCASIKGNFQAIVKQILGQLPKTDQEKTSYSFERHYIHYWVSDEILFLCIADDSFGKRIPFAFLNDIRKRWKNTYGDNGKKSVEFAMQSEFSRVLKQQMDYFSNDANSDRIREVQMKVGEVKDTVVSNIEKLLERGQKIELLLEKSDQLNTQSFVMKKKSEKVKMVMWWKNMKITLIIVAIVIILIFVVFLSVCQGFKCLQGSNNDNSQSLHPITSTETHSSSLFDY